MSSPGEALNQFINEFHADVNIDEQELMKLRDALDVGRPSGSGAESHETENSLIYQKGIHSLFMSVTRRLWSDYCKKYSKPNVKTNVRITKKDGDVEFYRKENELLGIANLKLKALTEN